MGTYSTCNGATVYEGAWINDKKHGEGTQTQKGGVVVSGTWQNDKMNGLAHIKKPDCDEYTVIFKDDMRIETNNSGITGCDKFYIFVSIFLAFIFLVATPFGLITKYKAALVLSFSYVVLLVVSCCQPATKYISNLVKLE